MSTEEIRGENENYEELYEGDYYTPEKGKININLARLTVICGLIGIITSFIPNQYYLTIILGILTAIFQTMVVLQWKSILSNNVENTLKFIKIMYGKYPENEKDIDSVRGSIRMINFSLNLYWIYLLLYFLTQVFYFNYFLAYATNFFSVIFIIIFLRNFFDSQSYLENSKSKFYEKISPGSSLLKCFRRVSLAKIFILLIITLGFYWWYILLTNSHEINRYIDSDENKKVSFLR